ncbi:MAG: hypothetical protein AB1765_01590 [Candidatus Hydrogenedentota bacterium]
MGKINVRIELINYQDMIAFNLGIKKENEIRKFIVNDALVDSGATMLMVPQKIVKQLGLQRRESILVKDANGGSINRDIYGDIWLKILNNEGVFECIEIPDNVPLLVGQIPLERFDLVVDCTNQKLVVNPNHPEGPTLLAY